MLQVSMVGGNGEDRHLAFTVLLALASLIAAFVPFAELSVAEEAVALPKPYITALSTGDLEQLEAIVSEHPEYLERCVPSAGETCLSPLTFAIEEQQNGVLRFLLDQGSNPNGLEDLADSPLTLAIFAENREAFRMLLDAGADPDMPHEGKATPLMAALVLGRTYEASVLLRLGIRLEQELLEKISKKQGGSGRRGALARMIREPDVVLKELDDALLVIYPALDRLKVQETLEQGANPDQQLEDRWLIEIAINEQRLDIAELLLEYNATLNPLVTVDVSGSPVKMSLLSSLIASSSSKGIDFLLSAGVSAGPIAGEITSPLIEAIKVRDETTMERLFTVGADPDKADSFGFYPIEYAIAARYRPGALSLISAGADFENLDPERTIELAGYFGSVDGVADFLGATVDQFKSNTAVLLESAKNGTDAWKDVIDAGVYINRVDPDGGHTPLRYAAISGDTELMRALLERGADMSADAAGFSPLVWAAVSGHLEAVHVLLSAGADPTRAADDGRTPLDVAANLPFTLQLLKQPERYGQLVQGKALLDAASNGDYEKARKLVAAGAPADADYGDGWRVLHMAARDNQDELIAMLLKDDVVNVDKLTSQGWSALLLAAYNNNYQAMAELLRKGADQSIKGPEGKVASEYAQAGDCNICKRLLGGATSMQAAINELDLLEVADKGDAEAAYKLLRSGTEPMPQDTNGWYAVDYAVRSGSVKTVAMLLRSGASVDHIVQTSEGRWTTLMLAANNGFLELTRLLLEAGVDKTFANEASQTAESLARAQGHWELAEYLAGNKPYITAKRNLEFGVLVLERIEGLKDNVNSRRYMMRDIRAALEAGAEPDARFDYGWSAVHFAARDGDDSLIELLISNNAEVDRAVSTSDSGNLSALELAAANGKLRAIELLLSRSRNKEYRASAIEIARARGHTADTIRVLENPQEAAFLVAKNELQSLSVKLRNSRRGAHDNTQRALEIAQQFPALADTPPESGLSPLENLLLAEQLNLQLVELLLPRKLGVRQFYDKGTDQYYTELMLAVNGGHLDGIKLLLDKGADPRRKTRSGMTALEWAKQRQFESAVQMMQARPAARGSLLLGRKLLRALHDGAEHRVRPLLAEDSLDYTVVAGAGDFSEQEIGWQAIHFAARLGRSDWVEHILNRLDTDLASITPNPLAVAVDNGHSEVVAWLLARAPDLAGGSVDQLLLTASRNRDFETAALLERSRSGGSIAKPADQRLALLRAVFAAEQDEVEVLLRASPNLSKANYPALSPLALAASNGNALMISLLAKNGFDANARHVDGATPLMFAAEALSEDAIKMLIYYGALPKLTDKEGRTARDYLPDDQALRFMREDPEDALSFVLPKSNEIMFLEDRYRVQEQALPMYLEKLAKGQRVDLLLDSLRFGNQGAFDALMAAGIELPTEFDDHPWIVAAEYSRPGMLERLLELEPGEVEDLDSLRRRVFIAAWRQWNTDIVLSLLQIPEFFAAVDILAGNGKWPRAQCERFIGTDAMDHLAYRKLEEYCAVYDWSSGANPKLIFGLNHRERIVQLATQSGGGRWMATGDADGQVIIWEKNSGLALHRHQMRDSSGAVMDDTIRHLKFTEDGKRLLIGVEREIAMFDIASRQVLWQHNLGHGSLALSGDGVWITNVGKVQRLNLDTGDSEMKWLVPGVQNVVAWEDTLVTSTLSGLLSFWSPAGDLLSSYRVKNLLTDPIKQFYESRGEQILSVDGGKLLFGHRDTLPEDPSCRVACGSFSFITVDLEKNGSEVNISNPVTVASGMDGRLRSANVAFSARGIVSSTHSSITVLPYDLRAPLVYHSREGNGLPFGGTAVSREQGDLYWSSSGTRIALADLSESGEELAEVFVLDRHQKNQYTLCSAGTNGLLLDGKFGAAGVSLVDRGLPPVFSPPGEDKRILCGSDQQRQFVWSKEERVIVYSTADQSIEWSGFSSLNQPDLLVNTALNQAVVVGTPSTERRVFLDKLVAIYDLATGEKLDEYHYSASGEGESIRAFAVDATGQWLAMTGDGGTVLYDLESGVVAGKNSIEYRSVDFLGDRLIAIGDRFDQYQFDSLESPASSARLPYREGEYSVVKQLVIDEQRLAFLRGEKIYLYNRADDAIDELEGQQGDLRRLVRLSNGMLMSSSANGSLAIWDLGKGLQARMLAYADGSWALLHLESGLFDASEAGMRKLYFRVEDQLIKIDQLKNRYFEPYLLQKLLGYSDEPIRDVTATRAVELFPAVAIAKGSEQGLFEVTLTDQGGGIGEVILHLNDKQLDLDAVQPKVVDADQRRVLSLDLSAHPYLKAEDNVLKVAAFNREGYLSSRGFTATFDAAEPKEQKPVTLYIVSVGVSDYVGEALDLRFASKDAEDMSRALLGGGKQLFGAERTQHWLLSSSTEDESLVPNKANIRRVFDEVAAKAKPDDILVVYLSGHGAAIREDEYFYLTADAYSTDPSAYTDPAIVESTTLSSTELIGMVNQSAALKQVMILDTCASGQVVENLTQERNLDTSTLRALERLQSRTGMHVITGSTADAVSYEASQYGQGLLTYSLLEGMKGAALAEDRFVDVSTLFSRARDRVPVLARNIGGVQQPVIFSRADSFYIGEIDETSREAISLASPKPIVLMSTFMNQSTFDDNLKLENTVDTALRNISFEDGAPLVFVEARTFPNGWRVRGVYSESDAGIQLNAALFLGDEQKSRFELESESNKPEVFVRKLVQEIQSAVAREALVQ